MTFMPYQARSKDVQDGVERHVWHELKYEEQGSTIKVKGTDTEDEEATVLVIGGAGFKLKKITTPKCFCCRRRVIRS